MNYREACDFIEQAKKYGSVYGLSGIRGLMAQLGDVQERLRVIHLAGTNGKGSVGAMLAAVLQAAGYRVGRYSSPAVFSYEELWQINGVPITGEALARVFGNVRDACVRMQAQGLMHPTAFEIETAAAFCYFYESKCDYVVLETGMGGADDATNLITAPLCSVFTSISRDHMRFLGDSPLQIAAAKAGIIKKDCPCVSAPQQADVLKVLQQKADAQDSRLFVADEKKLTEFSYGADGSSFVYEDGKGEKLCGTMPLSGAFQRTNLACVLKTVAVLKECGVWITPDAVLKGLSGVRLPGRFEQIFAQPAFFIDGAHNEGAAMRLRECVQNCFTNRRIIYIIGVLADKEYEKVLALMLPYAGLVYTVTPDSPRALDGAALAKSVRAHHVQAVYEPDIGRAARRAIASAGTDGVVLAFGSLSYLGTIKKAVVTIREQAAGMGENNV